MAARRSDSIAAHICAHPMSRQLTDTPPGLNRTQTWVLQAACDETIRLGTHRLTLSQVVYRLQWMKDSAQVAERALDTLSKHGYLVADDQPELPETVLTVTHKGFEAYALRCIDGYAERASRVLTWLARNGSGWNTRDVAHGCGISEFLAAHILEMAEASGLIHLTRQNCYVVVKQVNSGLRQQILGIGGR
ncbi:MAG: hypothetical protein AB7P40_06030 [Chloroflexota bacterium]